MLPWITLSWSLIFIIVAAGLNWFGFTALAYVCILMAKILLLLSAVLFPISLWSFRRVPVTQLHKLAFSKQDKS